VDAHSDHRKTSPTHELTRHRLRARMFGIEAAPTMVGRYRLLAPLGEGAMGTVCLARDEQTGDEVALKFVGARGSAAALLREAEALAQVCHPHVVTVLGTGVHEGRVWLAMEYVRGRTLRQVLQTIGEGRDRDTLFKQWLAIGRALAAVHAAGLIHRDVKPENAVVGDDGCVRLIDFGLAIARGGRPASDDRSAFSGTAAYAAPEQQAGKRVDARADQYSLSACMWEALTSARPRWDESGTLVLPRAAMLSPRLVRVLRKGMSARPEDRYACTSDLLIALERNYSPRR
jgi:serine/threonine protein kinase